MNHLKTNIIYNEDCILGMKNLPEQCVDIIIADPPYNINKDFGNNSDKQPMKQYLEWCDNWINECLRILKPDGTLYIYGFSEILAYIRVILEPIGENSKCHVRWIIWHYTNKVVPSLKFWQRSHESILVCYKDKTKKVFNRDDIREEYTQGFLNGSAGKVRPNTKGRFSDGKKETKYIAHKDGALPRDVIKNIATLAGGAGKNERVNHPTQKPLKLCEKLLKACMKKDEDNLLVVPFCGSGSECVAAKKLNIKYISYELNPEYIKIAYNRLNDDEELIENIQDIEISSG
jgi:site-specific DNA-methyltransferase (adenine-specific)